MAIPPPPAAEAEEARLARLRAYGVLDPDQPQPALDELVRRAQEACGAPMAWLSFFDGKRERLRARSGVAFAYLPREQSLAFAGEAPREPFFVEDLTLTDHATHPLVASGPQARFLALLPLVAPDGFVVGTLTVLDSAPRRLRGEERTALANLASLAMARLEARREGGEAAVRSSGAASRSLAERLDDEVRRRREAEASLLREKEFSESVLDSLAGAFFLVSAEHTILRWNAALSSAFGYTGAEIGAMHPLDFISARDRDAVGTAMREVFEQGREMALEAEIVDREGNVRPYALSGKPLRVGNETYMVGVARDITLRKRTEQQMARAKERLDLALSGSRLALWDWDLKNDKVYFNESWAVILGIAPRESTFAGDDVAGWTHPEDRAVFAAALGNAVKGVSDEFDCEYRVTHASGEWIWIHSRGKVTQREGGQAQRMTGTSHNISKRKRAEERAEYLATRDALTGLPNRVLLHDRLEQCTFNAARNQVGFAFMFIDLDRFKTINDSLGHQVGDELLKRVASRLTACVRATDTVARLGGDEFAVILENLEDDDDEGAQQVAEKMIAAMGAPMLIENQHLSTSCSIGISLYPNDGRDSEALMKNADVAMYYAKEKGRNNYQFFSQDMNARAQERLSVENYLRLALRRNELVLHYQPRVKVGTGELVGVEALVRWQHPRRGLLMPDRFIGVAEDSGLIVPIGEWVLEHACRQLREWQAHAPGLKLAVNLSVGQIADGERLLRAVEGALRGAGISAQALELEITESHLMQDIAEKSAFLQRLGELGVGLAIDDFGTGYSSLSYLKSLPVDSIKIDSSFVRDIGADPNDEAIIRAIVAMAHSLHLLVVAEGVENAAQLEALRELGCDEYQGFLESGALSPPEFEARYLP
ncbi:MAG TPA: EAL domain-containing protein [Usitatibacter sp.]|jgi:diguanylate cyclase (GGDEF)-like protein/PAS domain S-box-containing protein|nr:EAL domain-containing protein [Usitatibacter sp.]